MLELVVLRNGISDHYNIVQSDKHSRTSLHNGSGIYQRNYFLHNQNAVNKKFLEVVEVKLEWILLLVKRKVQKTILYYLQET